MFSTSKSGRYRPRALLTEQEAVEIYLYRKAASIRPGKNDALLFGKSSAVATFYNISPKAVRDIWNRRTWIEETRHLWACGEKPMIRTNMRCKLLKCQRNSSDSSDASGSHFNKLRPSSPSSIVLDADAWMSPWKESCSIYTNDRQTINHFYHLQATLQSENTESCSADTWSSDHAAGNFASAQHLAKFPFCSITPSCPQSAVLQSESEQTEEGSFSAEWGEGPLSGETADPFFFDWPHW